MLAGSSSSSRAVRRPRTALGWVVAIVLLSIAGCTRDPCPGGYCDCRNVDTCDFACAHEPCTADCTSLTDCRGTCGDACTLHCTSASGCDFECGNGCEVECVSVSQCDVVCGEGCAVACSDLSSCDVTMISGEVICQRAGACAIRCLAPDGSTTPAVDCGSGRFRCDAC